MKNSLPRALFIVNPVSGTRRKLDLPALIRQNINPEFIEAEVKYTEYAGHAAEIAKKAAADGTEIVVAVGGDGTVNEVASGLVHTETALAIVPRGSGNGLARHLSIPLNIPRAIQLINDNHTAKIDTGLINGNPFFTTAGIGFDAFISSLFAGSTRRGLRTYVEIVLKEFFNYKPMPVKISVNNEALEASCFLLTFANAAQYGNNAFIAPMADIQDGDLDIVLIREVDVMKALELSYGLLTKSLAKSAHAQFFKSNTIKVETTEPLLFQADGEYAGEATLFEVSVLPLSLKVIISPGS